MKYKLDSNFILVLLLAVFCLFKIPFLDTPYFWDEAWSYIPAIHAMASSGPCILPDCIDPEIYRGHPLLYYFTSSLWMRYVNDSMISMHIFALLISLGALLSLYKLAKLFLLDLFALGVVTLMMFQEVFFVQASFVLPEVLIMLLTTQAIRFFITEKYFHFFVYASLLGLTKEIGLVIIFAFILMEALGKQHFNKERLWIYASLLPAILFYVFQKLSLGWYLYPLHVDMVNVSTEIILGKLNIILKFIFIEQGRLWLFGFMLIIIAYNKFRLKTRNILLYILIGLIAAAVVYYIHETIFIGAMIAILYGFVRSAYSYSPIERRMLQISGLIFFSVIVFSAVNFLMLRYLIMVFPLAILIPALLIQKSIPTDLKIERLSIPLICGLLAFSMFENFTKRGWHDDVTLNYYNVIRSHEAAIQFCASNQWQNKSIHTHFLLHQDLSLPELGYLTGVNPFTKVSHDGAIPDSAELLIFSCIELDEYKYEMTRQHPDYKLIYRNYRHQAWTEIYSKDKTLELVNIPL